MTHNDDARWSKLDAAGLILRDAIAAALDRLRQQMTGLTAQEVTIVFERTVDLYESPKAGHNPRRGERQSTEPAGKDRGARG
jgi:hypothetical protein